MRTRYLLTRSTQWFRMLIHALQKFASKLAASAKIMLLLCLRKKKERPERERENRTRKLKRIEIYLSSVLMLHALRYARSRRKKNKK